MVEESDRLRQEIEETRAKMTRDVDLLAEKTSPKQVARRRWTSVKEKVMGSTEHAGSAVGDRTSQLSDKASDLTSTAGDKASQLAGTASDKASQLTDAASEKAHDAAGAVRQAPGAVVSQAKGNPVAAGIIAFGVGLLAATLIPATDAEQRAGAQLKEHSGDLTDKVKDVAGDLRGDLTETVQQAAGQVKETAQDAVQTTKDTAKSNAQDVKSEAQHAAS